MHVGSIPNCYRIPLEPAPKGDAKVNSHISIFVNSVDRTKIQVRDKSEQDLVSLYYKENKYVHTLASNTRLAEDILVIL